MSAILKIVLKVLFPFFTFIYKINLLFIASIEILVLIGPLPLILGIEVALY